MQRIRIRNPRINAKDRQRLVGKHCGQMLANRPCRELVGVAAITFEPTSCSPSLLEQKIRPLGTTVMVVANYEEHSQRPGEIRMPIRGTYARAFADGSVQYGGKGTCVFARDAAIRTRPNGEGRAIDYMHETGILEAALRMDSACRRAVAQRRLTRPLPMLPRILLGFAPFEVPPYEDSPVLRRMAAQRIGSPVESLGANGEVLLDRLLRDVWQDHLIMPDNPMNSTGLVLVDAELCTNARRSLQIFEDFSDLCGDYVWNPTRSMRIPTVDNPAAEILQRQGIDPEQGLDQLGQQQLAGLEAEMRRSLHRVLPEIDQETVYDSLVHWQRPIVDWQAAIQKVRRRLLPGLTECCTDEAVIRAILEPEKPLSVGGRVRVQLADRSGLVSLLGPTDLRRRVTIKLRRCAKTEALVVK